MYSRYVPAGTMLYCCMYSYFSPLEKELDNFLADILPGYQLRRKAGNIYSDIEVLLQPVNTPVSMLLPVISNINEAVGCFYVMEGSALGGTVIKKLLLEQNPDIPQEAFSFFLGYGEKNTGCGKILSVFSIIQLLQTNNWKQLLLLPMIVLINRNNGSRSAIAGYLIS